MNPPSLRNLVHGFLLVVFLIGSGVMVRRSVLHLQTRGLQEKEAPFILESALQYRMTHRVYEDGGLPDLEPKVQFPEGIRPAETYSLGAEWVYASLARVFPQSWSLASRFRWASVLLFCVGLPLFAAWSGLRWQSWSAAWVCGVVLVISPAFSVRASGLNLSRENLAFPVMALFLCCEVLAHRVSGMKARWGLALFGSLSLALAQVFWDLTQYLVALWVLKEWAAFLLGRRIADPASRVMNACVLASLLLAALWNPYLRSHGVYASFWVSALLGLVVAREMNARRGGERWIPGVLGIAAAILWTFGMPVPSGSYHHFVDLLLAKIRFLNEKPPDPALLNFSQRIMWTPALNSADFLLTKAYFPVVGFLFAASLPVLWVRRWNAVSSRLIHPAVYAGITVLVYVLFFRFHVFLIVFFAFGIGGLAAWVASRTGWWKPLLGGGILVVCLMVETKNLLFFDDKITESQVPGALHAFQQLGMDVKIPRQNAWGAPYTYYSELTGMTDWLRDHARQEPVLANFGVSGSILTYADCPILLHPKFETEAIRARVESYAEYLFNHDERSFRDWADALGAKYFVYSNGMFSNTSPTLSLRYMVDALEPGEDAAARVFEFTPQMARWFQPVYANQKYKVFRIVTRQDEEFAADMTELARLALRLGDTVKAEERALAALRYHWKYEPAQALVGNARALRAAQRP